MDISKMTAAEKAAEIKRLEAHIAAGKKFEALGYDVDMMNALTYVILAKLKA